MDISQTTIPDSTQVNAEDFLSGPRTVTVAGVRAGNADQPVNIDLIEYPERAYRPGKTMRRVLIAAWGPEASRYVGRRMTLYCDPTVKWGGLDVGGIRISHMSDIDKPLTIALTVTRGKRAPYVIKPLAEVAESPRAGKSLTQRVADAVKVFEALGITVDQLAQKQGRPADKWTERDLTALLVTYTSIQRGETTTTDEFPASAPADDGADPWGSPA